MAGYGTVFETIVEVGDLFNSYGVDVVVEFGVAATISPETADFGASNPDDVDITVTFNNEKSITGIYANKYLSEYSTEPVYLLESNYSIDGNTLTINSDYLSNLPEGTNIDGVLTLVIEFDITSTILRINIS